MALRWGHGWSIKMKLGALSTTGVVGYKMVEELLDPSTSWPVYVMLSLVGVGLAVALGLTQIFNVALALAGSLGKSLRIHQ